MFTTIIWVCMAIIACSILGISMDGRPAHEVPFTKVCVLTVPAIFSAIILAGLTLGYIVTSVIAAIG